MKSYFISIFLQWLLFVWAHCWEKQQLLRYVQITATLMSRSVGGTPSDQIVRALLRPSVEEYSRFSI